MQLFAILGFLFLALPAFAHYPEATTFKVFQFPDDHVPQMDGDAADWLRCPPSTSTTTPNTRNCTASVAHPTPRISTYAAR